MVEPMKSFRTLALIGLTTVLVGCSSSEKQASTSGNDLPVPANAPAATAPAAQQTEALPTASAPAAVTQNTGAATANVPTVEYTVVTGDSLWKIARDHKTSVAKIKALNGFTNDKLMPGQVIKVPAAQ